jgi:hypothetical protein
MGNQNSLMEVCTSMFIASLRDVASASTYPNAELNRDMHTVCMRVKAEGLPFLTKTVPSLGKAIDYALSTATPLRFRGFKLKPGTQLPRFLGWLIVRVFDDVGNERSDASIEALTWLRQVCGLLPKLEVPTTEKQNDITIKSFCDTDRALPDYHPSGFDSSGCLEGPPTSSLPDPQGAGGPLTGGELCSGPPARAIRGVVGSSGRPIYPVYSGWDEVRSGYAESVLTVARRLVCRVVGGTDPRGVYNSPRHGPGAVADGEMPEQKPVFKRLYERVDRIYPFGEYFCFNMSHICHTLRDLQSYEFLKEGTAKVVLVPKDSRGPRLISKEPKEFQWIQQGLRRVLERAITTSPLSSGMVVLTIKLRIKG